MHPFIAIVLFAGFGCITCGDPTAPRREWIVGGLVLRGCGGADPRSHAIQTWDCSIQIGGYGPTIVAALRGGGGDGEKRRRKKRKKDILVEYDPSKNRERTRLPPSVRSAIKSGKISRRFSSSPAALESFRSFSPVFWTRSSRTALRITGIRRVRPLQARGRRDGR